MSHDILLESELVLVEHFLGIVLFLFLDAHVWSGSIQVGSNSEMKVILLVIWLNYQKGLSWVESLHNADSCMLKVQIFTYIDIY